MFNYHLRFLGSENAPPAKHVNIIAGNGQNIEWVELCSLEFDVHLYLGLCNVTCDDLLVINILPTNVKKPNSFGL